MIIKLCKFWEYGLGRTILAILGAHSISISIGICQAYSAILLPQLNASQMFSLDAEAMSWIASLGVASNPIGSIISGICADFFGRKTAMQLTSIPFICGWLCIAFASSIRYLYIGRLITGIAAGMSPACYTYVCEVSMSEHRGLFQALGPACTSFGVLFIYILGYYVHWKIIALIAVALSAFSFFAIYFIPESPAHLARTGRNSEAMDSLLWLRRSNAQAQQELATLTNSEHCHISHKAYFRSSTIRPFLLLIGLFLLQECSGIYAVLFYVVNFFQEANLHLNVNVSSIIVGVIRFVMSIVAAFLIDKYPRKTLFKVSCSGMACSMSIILLMNQFLRIRLLELFCILFMVMFSMIGMLPVPWILSGELFPLSVRSFMSGLVICMAQCFIFISVKMYPDMIRLLSFEGTIGVFDVASLCALVFSTMFLPETKDRSLEEIEGYFKKKSGKVDPETNCNDLIDGEVTFAPGICNQGFLPERKKIDHIVT